MSIYISNAVNKVFYFGDSVSFYFYNAKEKPVVITNRGISFVVKCIQKGLHEVCDIASEMQSTFSVLDNVQEISEMIINKTIKDHKNSSVFIDNINESNENVEFYGVYDKRYPRTLHIELTGVCNFKCTHCYKNASNEGVFIPYEWLDENIRKKYIECIPVIHLTGGEPTLHKDFDRIVSLFSEDYVLQLSTNGSNIITYPLDTFKKFQAIDVSLYGLSKEEYEENTGCSYAYDRIKKGCIMLGKAGIEYRTTLVINNKNWKHMEDYTKFSINCGAKGIGFALPTNSGRLFNNTSEIWSIDENKSKIYRMYRHIQDEYSAQINITEWERTNYSNIWKSYPKDDMLRCGAGTKDWWMSEKMKFRPCSFLPKEYLEVDYDSWHKYISNSLDINWSEARRSLELYAEHNNLSITEICPIFKKRFE